MEQWPHRTPSRLWAILWWEGHACGHVRAPACNHAHLSATPHSSSPAGRDLVLPGSVLGLLHSTASPPQAQAKQKQQLGPSTLTPAIKFAKSPTCPLVITSLAPVAVKERAYSHLLAWGPSPFSVPLVACCSSPCTCSGPAHLQSPVVPLQGPKPVPCPRCLPSLPHSASAHCCDHSLKQEGRSHFLSLCTRHLHCLSSALSLPNQGPFRDGDAIKRVTNVRG